MEYNGVLLLGATGVGKTSAVKAAISECAKHLDMKITFYNVSLSDLFGTSHGVTEKNLTRLFAAAAACKPFVILLDEADRARKLAAATSDFDEIGIIEDFARNDCAYESMEPCSIFWKTHFQTQNRGYSNNRGRGRGGSFSNNRPYHNGNGNRQQSNHNMQNRNNNNGMQQATQPNQYAQRTNQAQQGHVPGRRFDIGRIQCYNCREMGHFSRDCQVVPQNQPQNQNNNNNPQARQNPQQAAMLMANQNQNQNQNSNHNNAPQNQQANMNDLDQQMNNMNLNYRGRNCRRRT
ncbi:unnamed protein product [Orchesella dallaii]|uniref:CCHC-type domain-containing protein n=1 Tax=Orchesella dallaii TaxID=48710 RepID=A0ABP1RNT3_9HEXA